MKVDKILQQVVAQSTRDAADAKKKKKKKAKAEEEDEVLASLRKGKGISGLHKDTDDTMNANTFDPDDDHNKSEKNNKQRQKHREKSKNSIIEEKQNVEPELSLSAEKKKKKVKKEALIEDSMEKEVAQITESEIKVPDKKQRKKVKSPPLPTEITSFNTETEEEVNTSLVKKKKKKARQPTEKDEEQEVGEQEEETSKEEISKASFIKAKKKKQKAAKSSEQEEKTENHQEEASAEQDDSVSPKPKPRKKKQSAKEEKEDEDEETTEQNTLSKAKEKKKKKVEKKGEEETEDVSTKDGEDDKDKEDEETETADDKPKKKIKAKAKKKKAGEEEIEAADKIDPSKIEDLGEVMALMVHRTDKLKNDFRILHPLVRVHVVNEETGEYIPKQHPERAVTSYFETSNAAVKTILPMMTQPFNFKERKSTIPVWEDLLVFNENFNYFVQPNPKVILLFEILDFVSMTTASKQFSNQKQEGGWHKIAWAFLKVLGKNSKVNIGTKLRLQLFTPPNRSSHVEGQPEVYQWWKSRSRVPYPSTLYITLKSIDPPQEVSGATRSMFATQKELGHMTYKDLKTMTWSGRDKTPKGARPLTTWTRLFGQLCRIPNNAFLTLTAGKKGCYVIKFSNDGRSLACACKDNTDYPILVYEIPSGVLKGQFQGHFGIVYSLSWSKNDTQLLSASSDGTARIWDTHKYGESQQRLLPHPGFVYTAQFHPRVDSIVVSGGFDEVIRVWDISMPEDVNILQQEMEEHHGHINSICFDTDDGQKMYSADSVGTILIWNVYVTEQTSRKHFVRDWTKFHEIKDPDLRDTPINFIKMHPSGRRLLVHARNNAILMFDLRVQRVMQKYFGAENMKEKICSTITPCGSFVFSGSEDGKVYAWNTDTGDQVAMYSQLNYQMPVTDVHYHPRDHMIAMCSLGDNHPVYVYKYDPLIAQVDASSPRPMSPIETTDVEDLEAFRASALKEMDLMTARAKVLSKEDFETQKKARIQRVMKTLDNATMQMTQMPGMIVPDALISPRMDTIGRSGIQSTWKMQQTFDNGYSLTPRAAGLPPGVLSPHAPAGSGTQLSSQILAHRGYMKASEGDWRPGFSDMGRQGARSQSPTYYGRPPHLSLNTSSGKPQFTFESPTGKSVKYKQVRAIYDYRAQRSDELTLYKGDIVKILYKDSDNWWMGELLDGSQGFIPANYVTEADDADTSHSAAGALSETSTSTVTAVKTKSGELKFVSGGEESDTEAPRSRARKKRTAMEQEKANGTNGSLPPSGHNQSDAVRLNDSIDALLDEYESVA
ncbi:abelson helper integration site 1 [Plakobranchus ocellatus]|uniref:Abelson helper integration site 1 n=1 Tax=Plakobranchus ocellatus TaxID=259542 RepID=A0AAV4BHP3_9GAST|nr:abelson helper integration site 1 [Plakobranchus ocellatus]